VVMKSILRPISVSPSSDRKNFPSRQPVNCDILSKAFSQ
jgi:hypothetical protein